jgi:hypothetical protein
MGMVGDGSGLVIGIGKWKVTGILLLLFYSSWAFVQNWQYLHFLGEFLAN